MSKRSCKLLFLLFFLPGCAAISPIRPQPVLLTPPGSLRAEAIVEIEKIRFRGRAVILVKAPDLVRMDLLNPFNQVASVILSDPKGLTYYSNGEVRHYGWDDPQVPYHLGPVELVSFLLGRPEKKENYEFYTDGEGNISRLVKSNDGAVVLEVSMDDWREVRGQKIPFLIGMDDGEQQLNIKYTYVELDPVIKKDLFLIPARGIR